MLLVKGNHSEDPIDRTTSRTRNVDWFSPPNILNGKMKDNKIDGYNLYDVTIDHSKTFSSHNKKPVCLILIKFQFMAIYEKIFIFK